MDNSIDSDLLAAHADGLQSGEPDLRARFSALFPEEMQRVEPLLLLAERVHALFRGPVVMRPQFRSELKAGLLAQEITAYVEDPS